MKKLITGILALTMSVACFAGVTACSDKDKAPISSSSEDNTAKLEALESAGEFLKEKYKDDVKTAGFDYKLPNSTSYDGTTFNITWSVKVTTEGKENSVKVETGEEETVINVDESTKEEITYILTATISDEDDNSVTVDFNCKVIVHDSIADVLSAETDTAVTIMGTVSGIKDNWNANYNNMSFYVTDGTNTILVYRATSQVTLGDIVFVSGTVGVYNDVNQIAQGGTVSIIGHDSSYDYKEMTISQALEAADNTNVIVTGTVVKIGTAYSSDYDNISVYIADDNGVQLYVYRLKGNVEVGQIIKVKGAMATHNDAKQIVGGTFEAVGTHTCPTDRANFLLFYSNQHSRCRHQRTVNNAAENFYGLPLAACAIKHLRRFAIGNPESFYVRIGIV